MVARDDYDVSTVLDRPVGRIQSVDRALRLLDFVALRQAVKAQEAATALGLNLTTTVHLLGTLVDGGYLTKHGRTYRWSADKVVSLYAQLEHDMRPSRRALESLDRISRATGESAYVSCWTGSDVLILAVAEGNHPVRVTDLRVGLGGDAHARASGKCLLAFGPETRLRSLIAAGPLRRCTSQTITEVPALEEELAVIRAQGYSIDRQEFMEGVCGIAAPLPEPSGAPVIALAVALPAHRFESSSEAVIDEVVAAAGDTTV